MAENDEQKVFELLTGLRPEPLSNVEEASTQLDAFPTDAVTKPLSKILFTKSEQGSEIAALRLLHVLVSKNAARYLIPASKSIKEEALRRSTTDESLHMFPELTESILQQIVFSDNLQVSEFATQTIVGCCKKLDASFSKSVLDWLVQTWESQSNNAGNKNNKVQASTSCIRCATAVVEIAVLDDASFQLATPALQYLLRCLQDDRDPLLQISYLDLLEKVATTQPICQQRQQWLQHDSVIDFVLTLAGGGDNTDPDPFLGGAALRIVAALCHFDTKDRHLEQFHRALHNFGTSEMDRLVTLDAISTFAQSSVKGLELILSDPVTTELWLSLKVAQPKLKASILTSVARVLDPLPLVAANGDSLPVSKPNHMLGMELFAKLGTTNGPEATELTLQLTKSPMVETRLAAYELLTAVAKLPTGGQLLFTNGNFYEFLVARDRETTKQGREAKFDIVVAILDSPVKGLLAENIVQKLEKFVTQGPHFVEPMRWDVAEQ